MEILENYLPVGDMLVLSSGKEYDPPSLLEP